MSAGPTEAEKAEEMERKGRETSQRTAIRDALTAARAAMDRAVTAVAAVNDTATDAQVTAADTAITNVTTALNGVRTAIGAAAEVPEAEKTGYSGEHTSLSNQLRSLTDQLATAKTSRDTAMDAADEAKRKEMAATGMALKTAIGAAPLSYLSGDGSAGVSLASAGLTVQADPDLANTGSTLISVTLEEGDSAGSLGDWKGIHYATEVDEGDDDMKVNTAVIYTNKDSAKSEPVETYYVTVSNRPTQVSNYVPATKTLTLDAAKHMKMESSEFPTAGTKTYDKSGNDKAEFRGSYHGIAGTYFCTSTEACTATYAADGITLAGTWTFVHDPGATVSVPSNDYLYFGWWLHKDKDGSKYASAFYGTAGTVTSENAYTTTTLENLGGMATYSGKAAGKFAIDNLLTGTGDAGHFTADVKLTAKFDAAPSGGGISGVIDNFYLNDVKPKDTWSVELKNTSWDANANFPSAAFSTANPDHTVWSINGRKAEASGSWKGTVYDLEDDGSNLPTMVTGSFHSEFGSTHSMVGAFGAEKDDRPLELAARPASHSLKRPGPLRSGICGQIQHPSP
ncbi:MAG: hypothetical protein F4X50_03930 [Synechococcus sp. SB0662_bin_14]|nr:hypothetical protein [Synechococcus sp. SB0662_bin_14]